ncbi:hypothetical protein SAMN05444157_1633 [Frankineae bacterium MT45]|nr:hypothetical protein SAMN05444157_1633 [Frankineae bacterium MT45]
MVLIVIGTLVSLVTILSGLATVYYLFKQSQRDIRRENRDAIDDAVREAQEDDAREINRIRDQLIETRAERDHKQTRIEQLEDLLRGPK